MIYEEKVSFFYTVDSSWILNLHLREHRLAAPVELLLIYFNLNAGDWAISGAIELLLIYFNLNAGDIPVDDLTLSVFQFYILES